MNKNLQEILQIREDRDWMQFHTPKNIALSLLLEASEVLEIFQWTRDHEVPKEKLKDLEEELADVYYWILLLSNDLGIDIEAALQKKLEKIKAKYPIEKSKGSSKKYTELK